MKFCFAFANTIIAKISVLLNSFRFYFGLLLCVLGFVFPNGNDIESGHPTDVLINALYHKANDLSTIKFTVIYRNPKIEEGISAGTGYK